jgi:Recombinase
VVTAEPGHVTERMQRHYSQVGNDESKLLSTTFIQDTGHQMELEAIRSRTREALRSCVREGRIAGGACCRFRLDRRSDPSGRRYTVAVVNPEEAAVIRRIFAEYLDGHGLEAIARALNREGVPSPSAGRRGTALESELASTRTEPRRLARAIALADDVAELASELRQRTARIQHLQRRRPGPRTAAATVAGPISGAAAERIRKGQPSPPETAESGAPRGRPDWRIRLRCDPNGI